MKGCPVARLKDVRENGFVAVVVFVDARLEGDEPFLTLVERSVDRPGLSDELMELEGAGVYSASLPPECAG